MLSKTTLYGSFSHHNKSKDYATQGRTKLMELQATEFLRRFILHDVPPGFVRIRH